MMSFFLAAQWVFLLYFLALNAVYAMLIFRALGGVARYMQSRDVAGLPHLLGGFAPPVTIVCKGVRNISGGSLNSSSLPANTMRNGEVPAGIGCGLKMSVFTQVHSVSILSLRCG